MTVRAVRPSLPEGLEPVLGQQPLDPDPVLLELGDVVLEIDDLRFGGLLRRLGLLDQSLDPAELDGALVGQVGLDRRLAEDEVGVAVETQHVGVVQGAVHVAGLREADDVGLRGGQRRPQALGVGGGLAGLDPGLLQALHLASVVLVELARLAGELAELDLGVGLGRALHGGACHDRGQQQQGGHGAQDGRASRSHASLTSGGPSWTERNYRRRSLLPPPKRGNSCTIDELSTVLYHLGQMRRCNRHPARPPCHC